MKVVLQTFLIASSLLSIASATENEDLPLTQRRFKNFRSGRGKGEDCIVGSNQCNTRQGLGCQSGSGEANSEGTCQETAFGQDEKCTSDDQCRVNRYRTLKCDKLCIVSDRSAPETPDKFHGENSAENNGGT